ncbi:hypothetical protein BCR34DRAFT_593879 [Clohesyomyces aquaticus]|uniref:Helicase C-terminal domain-containing protein n=1 Tax=Clohesyomyces aquaticus TaxID=1231657 RepID=A0A1Y1YEH8_9PLEO|nr:hypothetical protein BCR34DRAFT_593879 [Clohesyomyces aquaticus]
MASDSMCSTPDSDSDGENAIESKLLTHSMPPHDEQSFKSIRKKKGASSKYSDQIMRLVWGLSRAQLRWIQGSLRAHLNNQGILGSIQDKDATTPARLKIIKDNNFSKWWAKCAKSSIPMFGTDGVPNDIMSKSKLYFWEKLLAEERRHGEKTDTSPLSSRPYRKRKHSQSMASESSVRANDMAGLMLEPGDHEKQLWPQPEDRYESVRECQLIIKRDDTRATIVECMLIETIDDNFSDTLYDFSRPVTSQMFSFQKVCARVRDVVGAAGLATWPHPRLFHPSRKPLILNDNSYRSTIAALVIGPAIKLLTLWVAMSGNRDALPLSPEESTAPAQKAVRFSHDNPDDNSNAPLDEHPSGPQAKLPTDQGSAHPTPISCLGVSTARSGTQNSRSHTRDNHGAAGGATSRNDGHIPQVRPGSQPPPKKQRVGENGGSRNNAGSSATDSASHSGLSNPAKADSARTALISAHDSRKTVDDARPPQHPSGGEDYQGPNARDEEVGLPNLDDLADLNSDDDDDGPEEEELTAKDEKNLQAQFQQAVLAANLQAEISNTSAKAMEHMNPDMFLRAAKFWGVSPKAMMETERVEIHVSWGLRNPQHNHFYPYQLEEAYRLYIQELSYLNGGLLCNIMGMGKTRTFLLLCLIGHQHLVLWLEWTEDQANGCSHRHILPSGYSTVQDRKCPSASKRDGTCGCVCEESDVGIFYGHEPRFGFTLITGAGKSHNTWAAEFDLVFKHSIWIDPAQCKWPIRVVDIRSTKGPSISKPLTQEEKNELLCKVDFTSMIAIKNADQESLKHQYMENRKTMVEYPQWELFDMNGYAPHPRATVQRPSPTAGRFWFITNQNGPSRFVPTMGTVKCKIRRRVHHKRSLIWQELSLTQHSMSMVGRTVYDEFHNAKGTDAQTSNMYDRLRETENRHYQWKSWALSGTPLETGVHEITIFIVKALTGLPVPIPGYRLKFSNWMTPYKADMSDINSKEEFRWIEPLFDELDEGKGLKLATQWKKWVSKTSTREQLAESLESAKYKKGVEMGAKMCKLWVHRRTLTTRNPWGKAISAVPGEFTTLYRPVHIPGWLDTVAEAAREVVPYLEAGNEDPGLGYSTLDVQELLRHVFKRHDRLAYAAYPQLAKLYAKEWRKTGQMPKGWDRDCTGSIGDKEFGDINNNNRIIKHLFFIAGGNSKYPAIKEIVDETRFSTRANPAARRDPSAPPTVPAKIIVGSAKPAVAAATYLQLCVDYGSQNVVYFPGGMSTSVKAARLRQFRDPHGPFVVVASVGAFAESINLTEANRIVVAEPQDRTGKQDQFLFRIYRIGQKEEHCYGYILYNPASVDETMLLKKQVFKAKSRKELDSEDADVSLTVTSGEKTDWENLTGDFEYLVDGLV